jgi:hypothetical protein
VYVGKNYTNGDYPAELQSKAYLLKHFEGYIVIVFKMSSR